MGLRKTVAQRPALRRAAYAALRGRARLGRPGRTPRILVNSVPKAGTHLLMGVLDALPGVRSSWTHLGARELVRSDVHNAPVLLNSADHLDWERVRRRLCAAKLGQYSTGHLFPYPELFAVLAELDYRVVFVNRDPRDIVVSMSAYRIDLKRHPQRTRYEGLPDFEARLLATIAGFEPVGSLPGSAPFGERLASYVGWLNAPLTIVSRFEQLVGPRGGGSKTAQIEGIGQIADHIGLPLTNAEVEPIAATTWSASSATFRVGASGGWREVFTDRVTNAFRAQVGDDLLRTFGYEPEY